MLRLLSALFLYAFVFEDQKIQNDLSDWKNWLKKDIGYMPRRLYDLNSKYGSLDELKSLIKAFKDKGIKSVADITQLGTFIHLQRWHPILDGTAIDTSEPFTPAPDTDYTNPRVQRDMLDWMNWLKTNIAVGKSNINAFDFPTKFILQNAVQGNLSKLKDSNGKSPGLITSFSGKSVKRRGVTFIDNHDIGFTQKQNLFPSDKVIQGYAYILTHPWILSIFYDHFYEWGIKEEITKLTAVRSRNAIKPSTSVRIIDGEDDQYLAEIDEKILPRLAQRWTWVPLSHQTSRLLPIVDGGFSFKVKIVKAGKLYANIL
ncbi:hypothetical protein MKW92_037488 [Papaver armeniacum]|nr:hypothetical protein MKW92_037488 [Papaver armeniacum]